MRRDGLMGTGFPLGIVKYSRTRERQWLHTMVRVATLMVHCVLCEFLKHYFFIGYVMDPH